MGEPGAWPGRAGDLPFWDGAGRGAPGMGLGWGAELADGADCGPAGRPDGGLHAWAPGGLRSPPPWGGCQPPCSCQALRPPDQTLWLLQSKEKDSQSPAG